MPFKIDPEVGAAIAALSPPGSEPPPPTPVGDVATRRAGVETMFPALMPPMPKDVTTKDYHVAASDGHQILLRFYTKNGATAKSTAGVLYMHGGGFIAGSVPLYDPVVGNYVSKTGVPFLNVEYRLAPENVYPVPVEDCYAGLVWLHEHASELGIDPAKIAIMGDSGGGGMAAALTHLAKERKGSSIAKQILIYPMLDDRNVAQDDHLAAFAVWSSTDNETGWGAMLGSRRGTSTVPPTAAPARMTDATGLPPMYIETGELDLFRAENLVYAAQFGKAGVSVEVHVHPGCPHGYDLFAPNSKVTKRAFEDRFRAILSIEPLEGASSPKL
ncbi:hypothetical protein EJ08DRAFT_654109 [Tothia fuscella]|uniref:Alpha/beta hydrolase fold-3 domain-containing protein n=1 Tax=Tothia fuscella TaxID=1048955 RepID=A0A9P4NFS5_9PEZI|nr:hypothetical protein EJ08DRAFT_654109 [Tothia fuscella]